MRHSARHSARLALAFLVAGIFGGCALTSEQVREANRRTDLQSSSAPVVAVDCVSRKVGEGRSGLVARIRDPGTSGRYEAAIWRLDNTVAVVEAAPAAKGSTLTVFMSPNFVDPGPADLMEKLKGC